MIIFDPLETWKKQRSTPTPILLENFLFLYLRAASVFTSPSVMEIRDICTKGKDTLWDETKRL